MSETACPTCGQEVDGMFEIQKDDRAWMKLVTGTSVVVDVTEGAMSLNVGSQQRLSLTPSQTRKLLSFLEHRV